MFSGTLVRFFQFNGSYACKEQFSAAYVRTLAAVAGCSTARPEPDIDSEDLVLSARLVDTLIRSPKLAMQLKCTSVLDHLEHEVVFHLPVKNYNDLRATNLAIPRLLVILEVPQGGDPQGWLEHSPDRLCLFRTAYWMSLFGFRATSNEATVAVRIPRSQRLTSVVLRNIMLKIGNGERP